MLKKKNYWIVSATSITSLRKYKAPDPICFLDNKDISEQLLAEFNTDTKEESERLTTHLA